jgi:hypothetical protein
MFAEMFKYLYNVRELVKCSPYLFARGINIFLKAGGIMRESKEALHVLGGGGWTNRG